MSKKAPLNLLELRPVRLMAWEQADDGRAVVLVPKFRNPFLVRWLLPFFSRRDFRVKLDRIGSFVWERCDGDTAVGQITALMTQAFGAEAEPVYERIGAFLSRLEREGFISIKASTPPENRHDQQSSRRA
jgi:hypothetical protein